MQFFTLATIALSAVTGVMGQNLLPECAAPCNYVFDKAGCGPLVQENVACFCKNKDAIYDEAQTCLTTKSGCSLGDLLRIRRQIAAACGSN